MLINKITQKKNLLYILFILLFSIPALLPLFKPGFFTTDDGEWMIIRFSAFHQALRDGQFPVRFLGRLNQEYGYPVANFLYPGFMYFAEPFHIIGFNFVDSIKILLALSIVFSGVFVYFWLRKFFDRSSSSIGALFYIYTPYHLYDLYKRGSVGEILSLSLVPFILWQIERKSIFWSTIGISALIISHNTLAVLFFGLIIAYMALNTYIEKNTKSVLIYIKILLLGLGISAFFWFPAIYELQYTVFSRKTISNWKEYFTTVSLIGISTFFVLLLTAFNVFTKKIIIKKHPFVVLLFITSIISLIFSTSVSFELWKILPVSFIQFPFRFLSLMLICVSFLAAFNISLYKNYRKVGLSKILLSLLIFSAIPFSKPSSYFEKGEGYYATNMATTTVQDEYMPVWVEQKPLQRPDKKLEIIKGQGSVENIFINSKKISFSANIKKDALIQINTIYWPGWEVFLDGKKAQLRYNNSRGLIQFPVSPGEHDIEIVFSETPARIISDLISVLSLIILIIIQGFNHIKFTKLLKF